MFCSGAENLDNWLRQPAGERRFCETVQPITCKVVCPYVPESVINLLNRWQDDKKRTIFRKVFGDQIKNATPGTFEEVVNLYERAQEKYDRALASMRTGM